MRSSAGDYEILLVEGGLQGLGAALRAVSGSRRAILVTNPVVGPLWAGEACEALASEGFAVHRLDLPDGEEHKDLDTWSELVRRALDLRPDRHTPLVALGGGVTGDLAGFAAATLLRGLPLVQVPTTLLAMVDSSVGGKVGVNTPHGKNLVGAFYPPVLVYAAMGTLSTLPDAELRCGLGEVLKHGLLGDAALLDLCERESEAILAREPRALREIVERSCRVKSAVVSLDEREQGPRAVLNLGHTVGHAVETALGHGELRHGEAVAIGLLAEARWAAARGACPDALVRRTERLLARLGLPDRPPPLPRSRLLEAAGVDKKRRAGMLRTPILRSAGEADIIDISVDEIPCMIDQIPDLREDGCAP